MRLAQAIIDREGLLQVTSCWNSLIERQIGLCPLKMSQGVGALLEQPIVDR